MIEIIASTLARRQQALRSHAVVFWRAPARLLDGVFDAAVRRRPRQAAAGFLAAGALAAGGLMVTVHSGDTLSSIAASHCHGNATWTGTYLANKAVIGGNPDLILPGQRLTVKCGGPAWLQSAGSGSSSSSSGSTGHSSGTFQAQGPAIAGASSSSAYGAFPGASCIVSRESGGNAAAVNPSSGAGGLFQDLPSTWAGYGGYARAQDAPVSVQIAFNQHLAATAGLSPWAADGCPGT